MGGYVKKCVDEFPVLQLAAIVQPITRAVLRVRLNIKADFVYVFSPNRPYVSGLLRVSD